ncbi:MAG: LemA family protein, partial [bacterium]|nr:LemA family protein [bacterium]
MAIFWLIIIGLILYAITIYNRLITLKHRVDNAWAQIDTQLKRRYDLIPNLVETVKAYASHEREIFEKITELRYKAMSAGNISEASQANNQLTQALKSLFALAEAYPDLKANQNFLNLQEELSNTENKIAFARQFYNDTVLE